MADKKPAVADKKPAVADKQPAVMEKKQNFAVQEMPPSAYMRKASGISEADMLSQKVSEITKLIWLHPDTSEERKNAKILRALELYESLEPGDGAEGMLAVQMVGTHDAALECLKRAALPEQTYEGRDMALKHAHKLMTLYTNQLEALNKHRGKGQQRVTVEHVNVEAGGQAIVGNVEAGRRVKRPSDTDPAVEHQQKVPVTNVRRRAPRKKG